MSSIQSYPSLVEAPFIIVTIAGEKFGCPVKSGNSQSSSIVYPNFVNSIEIVKVNGAVNTYTVGMEYRISAGDDPNYLEGVFAKVGVGGKIYLSYGDYSSPNFIYKEEEAILTNITRNISFDGAVINYTISAQSASAALASVKRNFAPTVAKPSDVLMSLITNKTYGLGEVFPSMSSEQEIRQKGYIISDDVAVKLDAQENTTVLNYMNYLVESMHSISDQGTDGLNDSVYMLSFDDSTGAGSFSVSKVTANTTVDDSTTASIDVGYPGSNFVMNFSLNEDKFYSYLYEYSSDIKQDSYIYKINEFGEMETVYSPAITTSTSLKYTTAQNKSWWSKVTKFPMTATLTIKGLVKPVSLIDKIRVNVYFYGKKHASSGLYIITKQVDRVDSSGYRTTLGLTRIGGDV